ncbi:hypothetical protein CXG81DRAFT_17006 [Caulochytrium protostelioides]|uniref:C2H2-type domain-containing protein n=1 Tax=Caulochytrium protostelioides TaxID=1555241 RepID=A0A4P9XDH1_9FUNG|nr:hypothetical protein CXG81DRAFT_17006 [Caulochytrium protostelioides]|eukprot:RKP03502.1 hypothetical protein CXG81DRAFT_17006 [Caulochytrium protostelioides]
MLVARPSLPLPPLGHLACPNADPYQRHAAGCFGNGTLAPALSVATAPTHRRRHRHRHRRRRCRPERRCRRRRSGIRAASWVVLAAILRLRTASPPRTPPLPPPLPLPPLRTPPPLPPTRHSMATPTRFAMGSLPTPVMHDDPERRSSAGGGAAHDGAKAPGLPGPGAMAMTLAMDMDRDMDMGPPWPRPPAPAPAHRRGSAAAVATTADGDGPAADAATSYPPTCPWHGVGQDQPHASLRGSRGSGADRPLASPGEAPHYRPGDSNRLRGPAQTSDAALHDGGSQLLPKASHALADADVADAAPSSNAPRPLSSSSSSSSQSHSHAQSHSAASRAGRHLFPPITDLKPNCLALFNNVSSSLQWPSLGPSSAGSSARDASARLAAATTLPSPSDLLPTPTPAAAPAAATDGAVDADDTRRGNHLPPLIIQPRLRRTSLPSSPASSQPAISELIHPEADAPHVIAATPAESASAGPGVGSRAAAAAAAALSHVITAAPASSPAPADAAAAAATPTATRCGLPTPTTTKPPSMWIEAMLRQTPEPERPSASRAETGGAAPATTTHPAAFGALHPLKHERLSPEVPPPVAELHPRPLLPSMTDGRDGRYDGAPTKLALVHDLCLAPFPPNPLARQSPAIPPPPPLTGLWPPLNAASPSHPVTPPYSHARPTDYFANDHRDVPSTTDGYPAAFPGDPSPAGPSAGRGHRADYSYHGAYPTRDAAPRLAASPTDPHGAAMLEDTDPAAVAAATAMMHYGARGAARAADERAAPLAMPTRYSPMPPLLPHPASTPRDEHDPRYTPGASLSSPFAYGGLRSDHSYPEPSASYAYSGGGMALDPRYMGPPPSFSSPAMAATSPVERPPQAQHNAYDGAYHSPSLRDAAPPSAAHGAALLHARPSPSDSVHPHPHLHPHAPLHAHAAQAHAQAQAPGPHLRHPVPPPSAAAAAHPLRHPYHPHTAARAAPSPAVPMPVPMALRGGHEDMRSPELGWHDAPYLVAHDAHDAHDVRITHFAPLLDHDDASPSALASRLRSPRLPYAGDLRGTPGSGRRYTHAHSHSYTHGDGRGHYSRGAYAPYSPGRSARTHPHLHLPPAASSEQTGPHHGYTLLHAHHRHHRYSQGSPVLTHGRSAPSPAGPAAAHANGGDAGLHPNAHPSPSLPAPSASHYRASSYPTPVLPYALPSGHARHSSASSSTSSSSSHEYAYDARSQSSAQDVFSPPSALTAHARYRHEPYRLASSAAGAAGASTMAALPLDAPGRLSPDAALAASAPLSAAPRSCTASPASHLSHAPSLSSSAAAAASSASASARRSLAMRARSDAAPSAVSVDLELARRGSPQPHAMSQGSPCGPSASASPVVTMTTPPMASAAVSGAGSTPGSVADSEHARRESGASSGPRPGRGGYARPSATAKYLPTGERHRPYQCTQCDKRLLRRQDLNRHMATHLDGLKPWVCTFCGGGFTRQDAQKRHMKLRKCIISGKGMLEGYHTLRPAGNGLHLPGDSMSMQ